MLYEWVESGCMPCFLSILLRRPQNCGMLVEGPALQCKPMQSVSFCVNHIYWCDNLTGLSKSTCTSKTPMHWSSWGRTLYRYVWHPDPCLSCCLVELLVGCTLP